MSETETEKLETVRVEWDLTRKGVDHLHKWAERLGMDPVDVAEGFMVMGSAIAAIDKLSNNGCKNEEEFRELCVSVVLDFKAEAMKEVKLVRTLTALFQRVGEG